MFLTVPVKLMLPMAFPIFLTGAIMNTQHVMILRYNVPRLKTLLKYTERKHNNNVINKEPSLQEDVLIAQKNG